MPPLREKLFAIWSLAGWPHAVHAVNYCSGTDQHGIRKARCSSQLPERGLRKLSIRQPGPDAAYGALGCRTAEVLIASLARQRGLVGDDAVHVEIEQAFHVLRSINGPGINLLTATVRP